MEEPNPNENPENKENAEEKKAEEAESNPENAQQEQKPPEPQENQNQNEEISAVKEIKIYHGKKKLFIGVLNINNENIIDISENINKKNNSEQNINNCILSKC